MSERTSVNEPLKDDVSAEVSLLAAHSPKRFVGIAREQVLQRAAHLCRYGEQLLVIVADHDQGKTYFLEQLVEELKISARSLYVKPREIDGAVELLSQILELLIGEPVEGGDNTIGALLARIRVGLSQDAMATPVVLIDDANWLTDEVLSMLLSLLTSGFESTPLKVVMAGNKELVARLDRLGGIEAMIYDLELPLPLPEDWLAYAEELARYSGASSTLNRFDIEQILSTSDARYSRIMSGIEAGIFAEPVEEERVTRFGLPPLHIIAGVVLLALLLGIFAFGDWLWADKSDYSDDLVVVEAGSEPSAVIDRNDAGLPGGVSLNTHSTDLSEVVTTALADEPTVSTENTALEVIKSLPPQLNTQVQNPDVSEGLAKEFLAETEAVLSEPVEAQTAPVEEVNSFLQRPNSNYVLQIMAASNKATLEEFLEIQPNRDSIELIAVRRNDKNWYVLLQGNYFDAQQARNAIQYLPEIQRKDGVWPRSVGEVRRSIGDN